MSLIKQLWLATVLVMAIAFSGSMVVSVLSARHYLEQQLQVKNMDNATALALSLSQLPKDPITVELQIASQFDAGHYQFIRITAPNGTVLIERVFTGAQEGAPQWFMALFPMHIAPGQALIQDGWKQYGTLQLASQQSYAYTSLWKGTLELLAWFMVGALLTGVVGSRLLRIITQPLVEVVQQANGITERRFLTIAEPRTPEMRSVTRAMNGMVERLKVMFSEEAARLEALRQKVNRDAVTGLSNRDYFLSHLKGVLSNETESASGSLVLVRMPDLNELNAKLGHQQTDALLRAVGTELYASGNDRVGQRAGRIKGSEFAVICPQHASPAEAGQDILERLMDKVLPQWQERVPDLFHVASVRYQRNQSMGELLSGADEALAVATGKGANSLHVVDDVGHTKHAVPAEQWRTLLTEAVTGGRLVLGFYPVMAQDGQQPLHREGVLRLQIDAQGTLLPAGDFMPMAAQLNLSAPIDLGVVKLAIDHLRTSEGDIAVNLSAETIADFHFRNELTKLLKAYPEVCKRLLFEVPEYGVFRQFDAFCDLSRTLKELGCRVGIEYFGQRFAQGDKLVELGLDYIKVHPSYIHALGSSTGNQEFLLGLCKAAHAIGISVLALGVENQDDLPLLASLGFDGATGPGIK